MVEFTSLLAVVAACRSFFLRPNFLSDRTLSRHLNEKGRAGPASAQLLL
jgi:hypothetical protein